MDLNDAELLARSLMNRHGLKHWTFEFDRSVRRFGACHYGRRRITLSRKLTELNDVAEVLDTILHEIAHALVPGDGHGRAWKAKCVEIGAKPERCYSDHDVVAAPSKYLLNCTKCDLSVPRHRRTSTQYACRRCRVPMVWVQTVAA